MKKADKKNLQLLLLAALIGLLGNYTASYFFAFFSKTDLYDVIGIISSILFFLLIILVVKSSK